MTLVKEYWKYRKWEKLYINFLFLFLNLFKLRKLIKDIFLFENSKLKNNLQCYGLSNTFSKFSLCIGSNSLLRFKSIFFKKNSKSRFYYFSHIYKKSFWWKPILDFSTHFNFSLLFVYPSLSSWICQIIFLSTQN